MQLKPNERLHQEWVNLAMRVSDLGSVVADEQEWNEQKEQEWTRSVEYAQRMLLALAHYTQGYFMGIKYQEIKAEENPFVEPL